MDPKADLQAEEVEALIRRKEMELSRLDRDLRGLEAEVRSAVPVDPRPGEMLRQTEGLVRRLDHLRASVENTDRKIELLGQTICDWLIRERRSREARPAPGEQGVRWSRRLLMAALTGFTIVFWFLLDVF